MTYSKSGIFKFLDNLKSPNFKATYTDKGFEESIKLMKGNTRFNNPKVAKVLFLLTDGIPTVPYAADRWVICLFMYLYL